MKIERKLQKPLQCIQIYKNLLLVPRFPRCSAKRTPLINIQASAMLSTRRHTGKNFSYKQTPKTNTTPRNIHHCKYASRCFLFIFFTIETVYQQLKLYQFFCRKIVNNARSTRNTAFEAYQVYLKPFFPFKKLCFTAATNVILFFALRI